MTIDESLGYLTRRRFAATLSGVVLAGCSGEEGTAAATAAETTTDTPEPTPTATETPEPTATTTAAPADTTIAVGPEGNLVFDPEAVRVSTGDTVEWVAESAGHNVACNPDHSSECSLPAEAEPFTSYEGDQTLQLMPPGTTYRHTFTVTGEYVYVCIPHVNAGMIGRIVVR